MGAAAGLRESVVGREHVPELDGLRGLAILLVLFHHVVLWRHQQATCGIDRVYAYLTETGWVGVELFFVLSGFLITGILVDAREDRNYFRNFYARRALRIFPLYYFVLLLLLIVFPHWSASPVELQQPAARPWSYWLYASNYTILHDPHPTEPRDVTWSLAVEEQFYLVWPVVVWMCRPRFLLPMTVGFLLMSIGWRAVLWRMHADPVGDYVWTFCHLDALAMGAWVALLLRRPGGMDRLVRWSIALGAAGVAGTAATVLFSLHRHLSTRADAVGQIPLYTFVGLIGVALLVAGLSRRGLVALLFRFGGLRWFGKYSYGIYLYHAIAMAWIAKVGMIAVPQLGRSRLPAELVFLLENVAVTAGVAVLSWHLLERPWLRLKRYFPETGRAVAAT